MKRPPTFFGNKPGPTAIEYALIIAAVALAFVSVNPALNDAVRHSLSLQ